MKPFLIQHLLEMSCARHPDKACLIHHNQSLSYATVWERSQKLAELLRQLGILPRERVAILLDKSFNQVLSLLGILCMDAVFVLINPILKPDQIAHILQDCDIHCIITSPLGYRSLASTWRASGVDRLLVLGQSDSLGFDREIFFDEEYSQIPFSVCPVRSITDDTSHIIYTSGSTGVPKGIVVSHRNTIDGACIVSHYLGLDANDRILAALPFNFDYGLNQLINTLYLGATLVLHHFLMPNDLLRVLEARAVTVFPGMVPIWQDIFNPKLCNLEQKRDFSALRIITNTGGHMPATTIDKIRQYFLHTRLFMMYGLTEAFRSTFLDPDEITHRPASIGKAIPGVEILILNDKGQLCQPGEEGELVHRGALITKGYWRQPEITSRVFRPNPLLGMDNSHLETVVFSGDIVKSDADGFIYYVGRKDQMIKTKGYRVSPNEVEMIINGFEGVAGCVATSYIEQEEIKLRIFVILSQTTINKDVLANMCRRQMPFYLRPDDIVILPRFVLSANGKIDREQVMAEYVQSQGATLHP